MSTEKDHKSNIKKAYQLDTTAISDITSCNSPDDDTSWLLTYTDIVTLLITLFIVMIAHATFVKQDNGILPILIEGYTATTLEEMQKEDALNTAAERALEQQEKADLLRKDITDVGLSDLVTVQTKSDNIEIVINESVLFPTGQGNLSLQGATTIKSISHILKGKDHNITVEGHTDNIPIKTQQFPSNWELSASRALSIVHYLESNGIESKKLKAIAYGQTRPISENDTKEGRQKNRRVQIILN